MRYKELDYLDKYSQFWFFYNGPLSNWASTPFVDLSSGIFYRCVEQYMMHRKALLFGDVKVAEKILQTKLPRDQKALGRQVAGFDKGVWDKEARQIVYEGCYYKFTQNKDALDWLVKTSGHYLVEASPQDVIWGIGLSSLDEKAKDPLNWRGKNWLGQVLTSLREDLSPSLQNDSPL